MLQINNLIKSYGKTRVLDGLTLEIEKGSTFGLLGINGAGKTTTMRILAGLLDADHGSIRLDGVDVAKNLKEVKQKIGYMPDFFGVYDKLKVKEYMDFYASLYGITGKEAVKRCEEQIELVHLTEQANHYVDELSRGMKQRLCLARCMVHNPEFLILDEPTSGLDPVGRDLIRDILQELHRKKKTILISSHLLQDLSKVCSHIGIIEQGKMAAEGTLEEVIHTKGMHRPIIIHFVKGQDIGVEELKRCPQVKKITIGEERVSILFTGDELEEAKLLRSLIEAGADVSSFVKEESDLESLFRQFTQEEKE